MVDTLSEYQVEELLRHVDGGVLIEERAIDPRTVELVFAVPVLNSDGKTVGRRDFRVRFIGAEIRIRVRFIGAEIRIEEVDDVRR